MVMSMTATKEVDFDDLKALAKEKLGDGFMVYYGDDGFGDGGYTVTKATGSTSQWLGNSPKTAMRNLKAYIHREAE
jgi:hypothetical protein